MSDAAIKAALRARDWLAYHLVLHWPWSSIGHDRRKHLGAAIYWAALPYAGNWAYRHEAAAVEAAREASDGR